MTHKISVDSETVKKIKDLESTITPSGATTEVSLVCGPKVLFQDLRRNEIRG